METGRGKETWQEKLTRLENDVTEASKREIEISLQIEIAKEVKGVAIAELDVFRAQVNHPLFQGLNIVLPDALIQLCKEYANIAICSLCGSLHSCFIECVFDSDSVRFAVKLCKEDTTRLFESPSLATFVAILQSREEHFKEREQLESVFAQYMSKGYVHESVHFIRIYEHTGEFGVVCSTQNFNIFARQPGRYSQSFLRYTITRR